MIKTMTHSKVQNMPTPDLEQTVALSPDTMLQISSRQQTSLREREREKLDTARIGSRGIGARRAGSTRVKESKKAPPRQARRQRGTKPGQQRRISALSRGLIRQKGCAQQEGKVKALRVLTQKKDCTAKFKSVVSPACNAREKRQEEDAQSQLTAVRMTLRSR